MYKKQCPLLHIVRMHKKKRNCFSLLAETTQSAFVPDGVSCICLSTSIYHVDCCKYLCSLIVGVQLELNGSRVGVRQHSNATDRWIGVVPVYVQRADNLIEKYNHFLYVVFSNTARRVERKHDV